MIKNFKHFDLFKHVLITIPHSGMICPQEIPTESLSKYQEKLADECIDWYTDKLYDVRDIIGNRQVVNPISNVYLNVNRHPDHIDDCVPDFYEDTPIYKEGESPDKKLKKLLIEKYHLPFHEKIRKHKHLFILDGHSTKTGLKDLDGAKMEKDIIISNWQNSKLDPEGGIYTCPNEYLDCYLEELDKRLLNHKIERVSQDEIEENTEYDTTYGHIQAEYGLNKFKAKNGRCPLIFQETNEDLYMKDGKLDLDRVEELRRIIAESLMAMLIKMEKYLT